MAKVRYKLKDPETWLPAWARGKNLPVRRIVVGGVSYDVPSESQRGGFVVEVDDAEKLANGEKQHFPWAMRLGADPRFEKEE